MMFVGFALLIALGLALAISADAGSLIGLSEAQTGQLVPLLVLLVVFAGGAFTQRRRLGELLSGLVLWSCLFAVAILGYTYRAELQRIGARVMGELTPGAAVVDIENNTATFQRSFGGSFRVQADVNGNDVHMIFDTGASAVVLTADDAAATGVDVGDLRFTVPVQTANGTGRAAPVTLGSITVGGIRRDNIRAFVAEPDALETSLLGMTYLETLSGYSVSQDALVLND